MSFWMWLVGSVGMVVVLTLGKVAIPIRRIWPELLCCAMCSGVWVGLPSYWVYKLAPRLPEIAQTAIESVYGAFMVSLVATVLNVVMFTIGSWRKEGAERPDLSDPCALISRPKAETIRPEKDTDPDQN